MRMVTCTGGAVTVLVAVCSLLVVTAQPGADEPAVAGFDCVKGAQAMQVVCEAYGNFSMPCKSTRLHQAAKCAVGILGKSAQKQVTEQKQLEGAMKAELKAAAEGDIHQTVTLANKVYEKAKQMCSCKPAVAALSPAPETPAFDAAAANASAAKALEKVQKEMDDVKAMKEKVEQMPDGPEKSTAMMQVNSEMTNLANVSAAANATLAAASKTAAVALEVAANETAAGCNNKTESAETPEMKKLEKEGVVSKNAVKAMPADAQKALAKKIVKNEEADGGSKLVTAEEKLQDKQIDHEMLKEQEILNHYEEAYEMQEAGRKAADRGEDPNKAMKKERQKVIEQQAEEKVKEAQKGDKLSTESIQQGIADANKQANKEEQRQVAGMMKALPAGMGLRTAFLKIEDARIAPSKADKTDDKAMLDKAEKEAGKDKGESKKGLSKEAQATADAMQNAADLKNLKPKQEPVDIVKEEKKIEESKLPGKTGSDKVMFGKSSDKLADDMATPVEDEESEVTQL